MRKGKKVKGVKLYIFLSTFVALTISAMAALPYNVVKFYSNVSSTDSVTIDEEIHQEFSSEQDQSLTPPDTDLRISVPQLNTNPLEEDEYSPFTLDNPKNFDTQIEYDPESNSYQFQNTIGGTPFGPSSSMNMKEYLNYDLQKEIENYWRDKGASYSGGRSRRGSGLIPALHVGGDFFETIFGSNTIEIRPSGNVELTFGVLYNQNDNPTLPVKQRKVAQFNFDENIQLNVIAKIGDKIDFNLNYNTEANFDFENKMKLKYEGKEDEIIKLLEFGDVTMPINSSLIVGSQSLFGLKTQLQFGKFFLTAVVSQQKSETQTITVSGGAQTTDFYFRADEYEENRHYFLNQYFRDNYNKFLSTLPLVSSPIVITKIEVWRTTIGAATNNNRNIVAFTDLGEGLDPEGGSHIQSSRFHYLGGTRPDNYTNDLCMVIDTSMIRNLNGVSNNLNAQGLTAGVDYEKVENAKLLDPSEYTVNTKLGFISLNTQLSANQILAVAYQYTVIGDDNVYQVGEFSNEVSAPKCLRVKLLKSTTLNTKSPLWKLMMKNVYSLSAYQVSPEDFRLNVLYTGDAEGIANGFFNEGPKKGIPLIRLMGLDSLNQQQDPYPDGIFDFIDNAATNGGTINAYNGRIYFPLVEPFGSDLRKIIGDNTYADKYAFDSLYTTTKTLAQQYTSKNKYYLEGTYKSSSGSEISLNAMNVPEGSVKVTAGGITLTENVDYTVNYSMGTVSITNEGILKSGTPINISLENESTYGMTTRYMFGADMEYRFNDNFNIGATILNLREQPITQKVNYGDEPIRNTIWGMRVNYKAKAPWLTKAIDWILPFHSTTAESNIQLEGEFAHFIPGHSRAVGKEGTTYIDDFEGTKSTVDLKTVTMWKLASTPQLQPDLFPEAMKVSTSENARRQLAYGYNRAKLAWYVIDPIFYRNNSATPDNITKEDQSKTYAREVYETELFPYKEQANASEATYLSVFNMAFYPEERGPYNYDVNGNEGYSSGLNADGTLKNPKSRWGGIMRKMDNTDFESANYEYIEFWMMDPFIDNPDHAGGKLYFNLGDISEDVLRDGLKFFENGLPADNSDDNVAYTVWGRVPTTQVIVNAFDNDETARQYQDVGFDGMQDERELSHFKSTYLDLLANEFGISSPIYEKALLDPSNDNYHYFRGGDYDNANMKILERYKKYNNPDGNSPTNSQSNESYPTTGTTIPDMEDVDNDNTLNEDEKYYQYVIDLRPDKMVVGQNYINDVYEAIPEPLPDGSRPATKWYQFKVPIKNPDKVVGGIEGFNSIRFMRVFMRDFDEPIFCRLATFELVRSDWRAYTLDLHEDGDYLAGQGSGETNFNVSTLSYEENANRVPIPYVLPPGIEREQGYGGTQVYYVNEQALTMKATDLSDGDARAIYKSTNFDMRKFKKLRMFVHGEKINQEDNIAKGDVTVFIRLGSDFTENYYEYEVPLELTPWNVGADSTAVWPKNNRMEIDLAKLVQIKQNRNKLSRAGSMLITTPYQEEMDGHLVTVVGNPNLGEVRTIMIGIRNPKKQTLNDGDDMLPKSVEVWVNELRLCGYDESSGFAARGQMRVNLADIGDVTVSGTYSSPGFGTLEQKVTETQQESRYTVDVAANLDAGKALFPEKWNLRIPIHYDYNLNSSVPEYNPLNPDVKLKDDLETYASKEQRDSIKRMAIDRVARQNVNIMNVRKERNFDKEVKIRPWDIENFDFSYAYSSVKSRDVNTEFDNEYTHEGELGYAFQYSPKNWKPFQSVKAFKSKWLQLIRDFNINPLPQSFTFRTNITREFNEFKLRPKSQGNIIIDTAFVKDFQWSRVYSFRWDIAQSIKFEYNATAQTRLDEPQGRIDTKEKRDSIWRNFGQGGRMNYFTQRVDASWQIPINKIPLFNWITASTRYTATFNHTSAALSMANLGNTIDNSSTFQANGNLNFVTLYNNVPYLKKVNQGIVKKQEDKYKKDKAKEKKEKDTEKKKSKKQFDPSMPDDEYADSDKDKKKDTFKLNVGQLILDGTVRVLMLVRNASISFSDGHGTVLPGYMLSPNLFGINFKNNAPGFAFAFGGQPDIRHIASDHGWLTYDTLANSAFQQTSTQTINARATIEPFKDFRIDVTATRNYSSNYSEYYVANAEGVFKSYSPKTSGTFSTTYFSLGTFFVKGDELFEQFKSVRQEISQRYGATNPNSQDADGHLLADTAGYAKGYTGTSQDVLVSAFLATYGGRKSSNVGLSPFTKIPLPNWRLNYSGLTKVKGMNKVFQNFSITHAYTCMYTVGNFATNLNYTEDVNGMPNYLDANNNFIPTHELGQVTLSQQFSPLIGVDMTFVNSLMLKVEYKRSRNASLSFSNNQITEVTTNEFSFSAGYRFKDLTVGYVFSGMKREVVSDLNLTLGFSLRDNQTVLRKIEEEINQVSSGMLSATINFAADYQISKIIGLTFYYDHTINRPYISNQYNNMNIDCGIKVRLMLTQ
ncbi:MAG: cell surface protein SprA [Bacteroidales bacterium]|nr:cell surface protein SprA [Bacteroidales bacterium]